MSGAWLFRVGGLALLAGSVAFVVHVLLRSVVTAGADPLVVATATYWVPSTFLESLQRYSCSWACLPCPLRCSTLAAGPVQSAWRCWLLRGCFSGCS